MDEQLEIWINKYSEKDFLKIKKGLQREDLNELQSLAENRTEDQIKALTSVNRSHNRFLHEIKTKASQSSFNTEQLDNTMNLFD